VADSGLLLYLSRWVLRILPLHNEWLALVGVLVFACAVGTFVSHTVASIVLMPVIVSVGVTLEMPEVTVIGAALAISAAMALPVSSFPNVNAVMLKDDLHQPFLNVYDVVRIGAPMTVITVVLIATLGTTLIKMVLL
jgi:phosphate transporter